jgi:hypothetical protein
MILCRSCADLVPPLGRELQMVGLLGMSEDDAIEAVMLAAVWLKRSRFVVHAYHAPQRCIPWRMFLDANFQLP